MKIKKCVSDEIEFKILEFNRRDGFAPLKHTKN
jgi:hypothetical protein